MGGWPWWVVSRGELHGALVEKVRGGGGEILTGVRVTGVQSMGHGEGGGGKRAKVTAEGGREWAFDLVVGADGMNSIVRNVVAPGVRPAPPTKNAAFRAVVPMSQVRNDPVARGIAERSPCMEVWMGDGKYIISYPISGGKELNLVLSHHTSEKVWGVQADVPVEEVRETYKDFEEGIRKVVGMVKNVVSPSLPVHEGRSRLDGEPLHFTDMLLL